MLLLVLFHLCACADHMDEHREALWGIGVVNEEEVVSDSQEDLPTQSPTDGPDDVGIIIGPVIAGISVIVVIVVIIVLCVHKKREKDKELLKV